MLLLHVEEERAGHRVLARSDGLEGRRDAVDRSALQLCRRSGRGRRSRRCRPRPGWPRASARSGCRSRRPRHRRRPRGSGAGLGVGFLDLRIARLGHDQLDEGVARAGGRRRAEHLDLLAGSEGSMSDQFMVRVRLQRAVRRRQVLGERLEDLLAGEREVGAGSWRWRARCRRSRSSPRPASRRWSCRPRARCP